MHLLNHSLEIQRVIVGLNGCCGFGGWASALLLAGKLSPFNAQEGISLEDLVVIYFLCGHLES